MKILGSKDFENFKGFHQTGEKECLVINFESGKELECSKNHAVLLEDQNWVMAKELFVGDIMCGGEIVYAIAPIGKKLTYSPIEVGNDFSYYSNGIINHNCAFIEGYDEFFASVYPTISSGESTKLLMTSTPNGLNHFYKTCKGAKEGTNGYKYVEVMWNDVPGRDEKWKQETLEAIDFDEQKFAQEFCCEFVGSSGTLISGAKLKTLTFDKPIAESDNVKQFEKPIKDRIYVMTVDVSRGKGLDYSTFSVFDVSSKPCKQVCVFRDNMIAAADYASIVFRIATLYNNAQVLIEINDIGGQVADTLFLDYGYEDIIYTANNGRNGKQISGGFSRGTERGIRTTKTVKAIGCSILKLMIEQEQLLISDFDTVQELYTFSRKGNSYEAESGKHDDMVMTLVLFGWLTEQTFFKDLTDINMLSRLREKTEQEIDDNMMPFGFVNDGVSDNFNDGVETYNIGNW